MNDEKAVSALLPAGLKDVLPPDAAFEAHAMERLMRVFAGYGYERVKPPCSNSRTLFSPAPVPPLRKKRFASWTRRHSACWRCVQI